MPSPVYIGDLPPWEQIPLFDQPTVSVVASSAGVAVALCQASSRRTHLIISSSQGAGTANITINQSALTNQGLALTSSSPYLSLNSRDHGPLVSQQWFICPSAGITLIVFEVFANDWPVPDDISPDGGYKDATRSIAVPQPDYNGNLDGGLGYRTWQRATDRLDYLSPNGGNGDDRFRGSSLSDKWDRISEYLKSASS